MREPEHEEVFETDFEITDLDPHKKSNRNVNRWLHSQRLSLLTRLWMALFTLLCVALFSVLLVSSLHSTGASNGHIFTASDQVAPSHLQVLIVGKVIYVLDQNGLVSALWTRHKYVYLLWQHQVAPSSKLLRVDHDVVYLASPGGRIVALRASDGTVLYLLSSSLNVTLLASQVDFIQSLDKKRKAE